MTAGSLNNAQKITSCVKIEPSATATHAIIFLHGLGADGHDFTPIVQELYLPSTLAVRFIFPHAPVMPVTINHGYEMRAWFDIYSEAIATTPDLDGIAHSVNTIHALIAEQEAAGIAASHILLAGFSQGALIALAAGISNPKPIAGAIALSGYLPAACLETENTKYKIPLFVAHGTQDMIVPLPLGEMTRDLLTAAGYPVTWQTYAMAHSVCAEEIMDMATWIKTVMLPG